MKPKVAVVRGKFLNKYEMQFFEPLVKEFDITAFGSCAPFHDEFAFPVVKLPSPMDLPEFPYKMPILNRLCVDAQYLYGLEEKLKGFDLVHTAETYYHYTQQCLNAKRAGLIKKVIATVLENIPNNNEGIWGRKAFKARARHELDHIIALTRQTKNALITEGADPEKITVIGFFVDTKRFRPMQKKRNHRLTILFVGRLEEEKGVLDVIKAANVLRKDYSLSFRMVGDGSLRKKIPHWIDLKHVAYTEMPSVYQDADIFVAPSQPMPTWQEQYGMMLLEAQASGLPIVTTRTGAIPENIGDAALLVDSGDVTGLVTAIKKFILNPELREKYGARARKRAIEIHDRAIGAKKLSALYTRVLQSNT